MEEWDLFTYAQQQQQPAAESAPMPESPEPEAAPAAEAASPEPVVSADLPLRPRDYQQLAFGFLCSLAPDGVAEHVAIRASKPVVAAAGFWRPESGRRMDAVRSAAVVMYLDKALCFADCAGQEELLEELSTLNDRREEMEAAIRVSEPELAASDDLFNEFRTWNYDESHNREYHRVRRRIDRIMRDLNAGSRLERIRRAGVADLCYLAVPAGLVDPAAIPAPWGVVELGPGRTFTVTRPAAIQDNVTPEGRCRLALNIAQAASGAVKFASGVEELRSGGIVYHAPPRRRRSVLR